MANRFCHFRSKRRKGRGEGETEVRPLAAAAATPNARSLHRKVRLRIARVSLGSHHCFAHSACRTGLSAGVAASLLPLRQPQDTVRFTTSTVSCAQGVSDTAEAVNSNEEHRPFHPTLSAAGQPGSQSSATKIRRCGDLLTMKEYLILPFGRGVKSAAGVPPRCRRLLFAVRIADSEAGTGCGRKPREAGSTVCAVATRAVCFVCACCLHSASSPAH